MISSQSESYSLGAFINVVGAIDSCLFLDQINLSLATTSDRSDLKKSTRANRSDHSHNVMDPPNVLQSSTAPFIDFIHH